MGSVEEVRPTGTPISSSTLLATRHTYEGYTDLRADSLCVAIGIEFIAKTDGIPKLLERVDAGQYEL